MEAVSAEHMLLEAGKSAELIAAFRTVAEAEFDGEPRFTSVVSRDLAKIITCRAYAPAVLELCHLVNIAEACGQGRGRFETLFWAHPLARAGAFHGFIRKSAEKKGWRRPGFVAGTAGVDIAYPDGAFSVSYPRMPFLAALLEFLVTTLEYPTLDDLFRRMVAAGPTAAAVSEHANELSRRVYGYLKDHLPSAQNQRKFHALTGYLVERWEGDFDASCIDDASVLDFWRVESLGSGGGGQAGDGTDFKTFLTVFKTFVRLRQALEQASDLHELENPRTIGSDREAGEVDPDALLGLVETVEEQANPLHILGEPPADAIKFLNKREAGELELLMDCGRTGLDLPLSLMRGEVFGKGQARITQALRRRARGTELKTLLDSPADEDYESRRTGLVKLSGHMRRMLLASLHLLLRAGSAEVVSLMLILRPDLDLMPLRKALSARSSAPHGTLADQVSRALEDPAKVGADIAALISEAKAAMRGLSRQGFTVETAADPEGARGFSVGVRTLRNVDDHVQAFQRLLEHARLPEGDWATQFAGDQAIFSRQFHLLYGDDR